MKKVVLILDNEHPQSTMRLQKDWPVGWQVVERTIMMYEYICPRCSARLPRPYNFCMYCREELNGGRTYDVGGNWQHR